MTTHPDVKKSFVDAGSLVKGMSLHIIQQVLQGLCLGGAVLFQEVFERHDKVGVRHRGERRGLGQIRQGSRGYAAEAAQRRVEASRRSALLNALHGLVLALLLTVGERRRSLDIMSRAAHFLV